LFKTGSICIYEKEDFFNWGNRNNQKEQLFLFNVDEFIEDVKSNRKIKYKLIEFKGDYGSIEVWEVNKNEIIYTDVDFRNKLSIDKKYNIYTGEIEELIRDNYTDKYGMNIVDNYNKQFNKSDYNINFNIDERDIKYANEKILIYTIQDIRPNEDESDVIFKYTTIIYDIENNKVLEKYENRKAVYIDKIDSLILN
jgi:hypothetical protein